MSDFVVGTFHQNLLQSCSGQHRSATVLFTLSLSFLFDFSFTCRHLLNHVPVRLPNVLWSAKALKKLDVKYATLGGSFVNYDRWRLICMFLLPAEAMKVLFFIIVRTLSTR